MNNIDIEKYTNRIDDIVDDLRIEYEDIIDRIKNDYNGRIENLEDENAELKNTISDLEDKLSNFN